MSSRRKTSALDVIARGAAITARSARDAQALERGTFPRRYARRQVRRKVSGPLADLIWRSFR